MRTKFPFLAGAIALALAGNATATEGEAVFLSFSGLTSSGGSSSTSVQYFPGERTYPRDPSLDFSGRDLNNQTFHDLAHSRDNTDFYGNADREVPGSSGGALNHNTFFWNFNNDNEFAGHSSDTKDHLNCSILAVPEPSEWLLMLFGIGVTILIARFRRQQFFCH